MKIKYVIIVLLATIPLANSSCAESREGDNSRRNIKQVATATSQTAAMHHAEVNDKIGLFVTPDVDSKDYTVTSAHALATLKGYAKTVWILERWPVIETRDNTFDWTSIDRRVEEARRNGFDIGLRLQFILCGNTGDRKFLTISQVPGFVNQDMGSEDFRDKAARFCRTAAERYKGKIRYIAIGNSINDYFDNNPKQWDGFKKNYPAIVTAIRSVDPKIVIMPDLALEPREYQKYLDYFSSTDDDAIGLIMYFIVPEYYGGDFKNFSGKGLAELLDKTYEGGHRKKKLYILETSCFSRNPNSGDDLSGVQTMYVDFLMRTVMEKDYILGFSWWQLYDAQDRADITWDSKASFGLFDAAGKPKPAWEKWKELCTLKKSDLAGEKQPTPRK